MNETTTTECKTVRAPTFVGWLRTEWNYPRGEVGWIAGQVTGDVTDGCLTATSADGVRTHVLEKHDAEKQPRQRALKALDIAEKRYDRHVRQLEATCRRIRYEFIPVDPEAPC